MSRFDLSNAADFSRVTQQGLGTALAIEGRDPNQWDLLEGSYNGVVFHVFKSKINWQGALSKIQDSTGRRKVKYQFPYRDGQTTDDLGRKPNSFQMEILLFGLRYKEGFSQLLTEFDKPTPGKLIHPIRGGLTVAVDDVQISYTSDQRKAVVLNVTFIEHNFTVGDLSTLKDTSVKSKLADALKAFQKLDALITAIENSTLFVRGVKNFLQGLINSYKTDTGLVLASLNVTFNLGATTGSSVDIPSLLPTNQGGTRNSDGTLESDNFVVVRSVSDPFNSVPLELLTPTSVQALAVQQLKKQIETLRTDAANIISEIAANGGELELFDNILNLRQTVILIQDAFEAGAVSSKATVIDYVTPRVMSLREVAFENGVDVNRVQDLDILNPSLLSTNFIPSGVLLKVPVA
jgi:prophage DNA circulation protein